MIIEQGNLTLQLHAARYAFHAVVKAKYKIQLKVSQYENINNDPAARDKASELYRKAMENYDGIIANAVSGASHDANQREMDKGFE